MKPTGVSIATRGRWPANGAETASRGHWLGTGAPSAPSVLIKATGGGRGDGALRAGRGDGSKRGGGIA
jgi:hypothetical protein